MNEHVDFKVMNAELVAALDKREDKAHLLEATLLAKEEELEALGSVQQVGVPCTVKHTCRCCWFLRPACRIPLLGKHTPKRGWLHAGMVMEAAVQPRQPSVPFVGSTAQWKLCWGLAGLSCIAKLQSSLLEATSMRSLPCRDCAMRKNNVVLPYKYLRKVEIKLRQ